MTDIISSAQTGAGVAGLRPAALVECQSIGSHLRFMKPAEHQASGQKEQEHRSASASLENPDGSAAVPRILLTVVADAELRSLATSCCLETLWPLPRAIVDLQKALAPAKKSPAAPPRFAMADRWKSAARSAKLHSAASESMPEAQTAACAAEGAPGLPGGIKGAGSAHVPGLSIDPSLITGPSLDPGDPPSAATSPEDADADALQRERIAMSSQASTPGSSTAAQAAREAWASSFRSASPFEQAGDRLVRRRSISGRSAGALSLVTTPASRSVHKTPCQLLL